MRFASIRDFRVNASSVLLKAGGEETVVVTLRGKPVALFVPINETQLEDMAQAIKLARLRTSVERLREQARKSGAGRLGPAAIDREIKAARNARHA